MTDRLDPAKVNEILETAQRTAQYVAQRDLVRVVRELADRVKEIEDAAAKPAFTALTPIGPGLVDALRTMESAPELLQDLKGAVARGAAGNPFSAYAENVAVTEQNPPPGWDKQPTPVAPN
jgi:ClpP class serine protease